MKRVIETIKVGVACTFVGMLYKKCPCTNMCTKYSENHNVSAEKFLLRRCKCEGDDIIAHQ